MKKITGLKKAIGDYKDLNKGGSYHPLYGYLMFNTATREVWTDEFYDFGHGTYKAYHDAQVVNLGRMMEVQGIEINMKNVKDFIEKNFK